MLMTRLDTRIVTALLARDVEPFLFKPTDRKKVVQFEAVVRQYAF